MTDVKRIPKKGYRMRKNPKGGSKPGRICLDWENHPQGRLCKIASQALIGRNDREHWTTRNFGGYKVVDPLVALMPDRTPDFWKLLKKKYGDDIDGIRKCVYHRGHKGAYENFAARGEGRAITGHEHYSRNSKLTPYVEEAFEVFKGLL